MIPRYYQNDAVYSFWDYFKSGKDGNPIIAMPTGTGKSLVIASLIQSILYYYPNQRILKLTHVKELIEQNFDKLINIWPTAPAGIYSSGLNRRDMGSPILYAGIASIYKRAEEVGHIDIIIIDECHLVSPKQNSMYWILITALKEINPYLKVVGLTATPYRLGQGLLTNQPSLFTDICYNLCDLESFNKLIEEGYLSPLIPKPTSVKIDTNNVAIHGGEFVSSQLQEVSDQEKITYGALTETLEVAGERKHWLIFATSIQHAENIQTALDSMGVTCGIVHSKMTTKERDKEILKFKCGYYTALVNVGVLTTGFDYPEIDLIIMLRPTNSTVLWIQMLGRGTRPLYAEGFDLSTIQGRLDAIAASEKQDCMVLDFAGNTPRLGPINDPVIPKPKGNKPGSAPIRICDGCGIYIHASLKYCPHCDYYYPPQIKFKATAGTHELIAKKKKDPVLEKFDVNQVTYRVHKKKGSPDSIKVTYLCGLRAFNKWICLFHGNYPTKLAMDWWRKVHPDGKEAIKPESMEEAMAQVDNLKTPKKITVRTDLKNPEILDFSY